MTIVASMNGDSSLILDGAGKSANESPQLLLKWVVKVDLNIPFQAAQWFSLAQLSSTTFLCGRAMAWIMHGISVGQSKYILKQLRLSCVTRSDQLPYAGIRPHKFSMIWQDLWSFNEWASSYDIIEEQQWKPNTFILNETLVGSYIYVMFLTHSSFWTTQPILSSLWPPEQVQQSFFLDKTTFLKALLWPWSTHFLPSDPMTYEVIQGCEGQLMTIGRAILVVVPVSHSLIKNRWHSFSWQDDHCERNIV